MVFTRVLFGRSLTVGLSKRPPGRSILLSLTQGEVVEIVATISSFDLILLSVAIEVFFRKCSPPRKFHLTVSRFLMSMLQQSLTGIGEHFPQHLVNGTKTSFERTRGNERTFC